MLKRNGESTELCGNSIVKHCVETKVEALVVVLVLGRVIQLCHWSVEQVCDAHIWNPEGLCICACILESRHVQYRLKHKLIY